ncbi:putative dihydrolipoamide acetyltransferase component of pyruvate dehydrogenase complex mitochondrial precursor [Ceraceosorus guamensis]|uniref:Acetyltransferase component of pyruvate dehydrogenase complex n=1 Tax=Ceraceosorus guamensis TaxID=1522189 RepID=A0A316W4K6_9BASI|nr:putative dihydrolipoamide acetyltransferase component of pyruvate dehydrogenase complex mitochondrial precursor [Ceraceosorus guamensis]PWN44652.1 putative dihydrolipoamide acetyltransferase component of pyruvate dehydrogenase complex mitochondrial precursor [Ceraceosorus guamensis]
MLAAVRRLPTRASGLVSPRIVAASSNVVRAAAFSTSSRVEALSKFNMPAMSPTMTEGGIAAWKKQPGESFSAGEVLLEIETDKATMDVEAQEDGIMAKIIVGDGSKAVPVNSPIAIIGEEGDDISGADALAAEAEKDASQTKSEPKEESKPEAPEPPKSEPKKEEPVPASQPAASSSGSAPVRNEGERVIATPVARRIAQEKGIPLSKVKGTGPEGRIIKADVEAYQPEAAGAAAPATSPSAPSKSAAAPSAPAPAPSSSADYEDTPVSSMRRVIASRLTESKQQLPHYYVSIDVEMDKVLQLRAAFNAASEAKAGGDKQLAKQAKLSVGDFITKAASVALREVPEVNAAWYGDFIRSYKKADISIAVATPTGLITPIVRDVGGTGLASISAQTKALAARARDGKLKPEEYQGGSFTISNMGMFGITHFTAIINPPQACILAIGGTDTRIVPDDSSEQGWRKANVMQATISADHRIVDGATAARWMKAFKDALENPLSFML